MKKQRQRKAVLLKLTQPEVAELGLTPGSVTPDWHVITSSFCIQSVSVPFEDEARVSSSGRRGRLDTLWGRRNSCSHSLHVRTASQARLMLTEAGVLVKEQGLWTPGPT